MALHRGRWLAFASVLAVSLLILSGWAPYDRLTWWLEVLPVMIALPIMWFSYRRYPLTSLLYIAIFMHAAVLILGGAYTYARVPVGFQLQELLDLSRNPYDKIGHFFQGFTPALIAREILVRGLYVRVQRMLVFLIICVVLAISASYELIEWAAALIMGQDAEAFLGTQGDPWDTQSDMFFALLGAVCALLCCSHLHDLQLKRMFNA